MLAFALCLCASACAGGAPSAHPVFTMGGFSIQRLEGCQTLMMLLPMSDAFAPNVNVQVQPYPGTLEDYIALSRQQCHEAGWKIVSQKKGKSSLVIEYRGSMGGPDLHWYSRAELRQKKAYLATATALETQWPSTSRRLKACVDSLRVAN
jgi:hypothetical protein